MHTTNTHVCAVKQKPPLLSTKPVTHEGAPEEGIMVSMRGTGMLDSERSGTGGVGLWTTAPAGTSVGSVDGPASVLLEVPSIIHEAHILPVRRGLWFGGFKSSEASIEACTRQDRRGTMGKHGQGQAARPSAPPFRMLASLPFLHGHSDGINPSPRVAPDGFQNDS